MADPTQQGPLDLALIDLGDRLTLLPKYYTYRDVLAIAFNGNEDHFLDAFCDGTLPWDVRKSCEETMSERQLENWLLRRLVRQMNQLIAVVSSPAGDVDGG